MRGSSESASRFGAGRLVLLRITERLEIVDVPTTGALSDGESTSRPRRASAYPERFTVSIQKGRGPHQFPGHGRPWPRASRRKTQGTRVDKREQERLIFHVLK